MVLGHQSNARQSFPASFTPQDRAPIAISLLEQARMHERRRIEAVCEVMCLVGILRYRRILKNPVPVTLGHTVLQYNSGNKEDGTNAAHVLPGQLLFAGEEPNDILVNAGEAAVRRAGIRALPISMKMRNLFGQTDIVHTPVNNADSAVEGKRGWGRLKSAFPASVESLLQTMENPAPKDWPGLLLAVKAGYDTYHKSAHTIYADARLRAVEKIKSIPGRKDYYRQRVDILDAYTLVLQSQKSPDGLRVTDFYRLLRDMVEDAPIG